MALFIWIVRHSKSTLPVPSSQREALPRIARQKWTSSCSNLNKLQRNPEVSKADLIREIDRGAAAGLLTGDAVNTLYKMVDDSEGAVRQQRVKYTELRAMSQESPESRQKFVAMDLNAEAGNISDEQLERLQTLQRDLRDGRGTTRTGDEYRAANITIAKLDPKDEDDADLIEQYDRAVEGYLQGVQAKTNLPPTPNDVRIAHDQAAATVIQTKRQLPNPSTWYKPWTWERDKTVREAGVSPEFIDRMYREAGARGESMPSPEQLVYYWQKYQEELAK